MLTLIYFCDLLSIHVSLSFNDKLRLVCHDSDGRFLWKNVFRFSTDLHGHFEQCLKIGHGGDSLLFNRLNNVRLFLESVPTSHNEFQTRHCCVRGCKAVTKNGLHGFPSDKVVAQKWITAIKDENLVIILNESKLSHSYRKVCKKHFAETDFGPSMNGKYKLKPNSVPSLFLPEEAAGISSQALKPKKRLHQRSQQLPRSIARSNVNGVITTPSNDNAENEWIDVDSINDIEMMANTNALLRQQEQKSQEQWKHSENKLLKQIRSWKKKIANLQLRVKNSKINSKKVLSYLNTIFNEAQFEIVKMQKQTMEEHSSEGDIPRNRKACAWRVLQAKSKTV